VRKIAWFAALYLGGVLGLTVVVYALKLLVPR
jgi:hypothetical protein